MVIDLILDRRDGDIFDPVEFANEVHDYCDVFPELQPIDDAIGSEVEQRVKHALCGYVLDGGYPPEICDFINSVPWLADWWDRD